MELLCRGGLGEVGGSMLEPEGSTGVTIGVALGVGPATLCFGVKFKFEFETVLPLGELEITVLPSSPTFPAKTEELCMFLAAQDWMDLP